MANLADTINGSYAALLPASLSLTLRNIPSVMAALRAIRPYVPTHGGMAVPLGLGKAPVPPELRNRLLADIPLLQRFDNSADSRHPTHAVNLAANMHPGDAVDSSIPIIERGARTPQLTLTLGEANNHMLADTTRHIKETGGYVRIAAGNVPHINSPREVTHMFERRGKAQSAYGDTGRRKSIRWRAGDHEGRADGDGVEFFLDMWRNGPFGRWDDVDVVDAYSIAALQADNPELGLMAIDRGRARERHHETRFVTPDTMVKAADVINDGGFLDRLATYAQTTYGPKERVNPETGETIINKRTKKPEMIDDYADRRVAIEESILDVVYRAMRGSREAGTDITSLADGWLKENRSLLPPGMTDEEVRAGVRALYEGFRALRLIYAELKNTVSPGKHLPALL